MLVYYFPVSFTPKVTGTVSLSDVDTSKAELNLEKRFLDVGLYKIYYKMTMDGSYGVNKFEDEKFTYVRVIGIFFSIFRHLCRDFCYILFCKLKGWVHDWCGLDFLCPRG